MSSVALVITAMRCKASVSRRWVWVRVINCSLRTTAAMWLAIEVSRSVWLRVNGSLSGFATRKTPSKSFWTRSGHAHQGVNARLA